MCSEREGAGLSLDPGQAAAPGTSSARAGHERHHSVPQSERWSGNLQGGRHPGVSVRTVTQTAASNKRPGSPQRLRSSRRGVTSWSGNQPVCFSGRQVLTPAYSLGSPHKKPAGPCFCGSRGWERREHWGPGGWWGCHLPGAQGGGGLSRSESLGPGTNWGTPVFPVHRPGRGCPPVTVAMGELEGGGGQAVCAGGVRGPSDGGQKEGCL